MTVSPARSRSLAASVRAYVALTKPRVIELLLVTTVPTMVIAQGGLPDAWLVVHTLLGGTLSAAGANAINSWADRDIDRIMARTARRPLAEDTVAPGRALAFGVILGVLAFVWLAVAVNLLAASLATGALLFYVFVYTLGLKRRSTQNIVIGGAAGCVPVLVGWAAVTGGLGLPAWVLFAIVFLWTPPHFWALAYKYRDDYARAGVPMLPVVVGLEATARQILAYSVALVALTLVFGPLADLGLLYLVSAAVLGAGLLVYAVRLLRKRSEAVAMALFRYSISYLGLLFVLAAVDASL